MVASFPGLTASLPSLSGKAWERGYFHGILTLKVQLTLSIVYILNEFASKT